MEVRQIYELVNGAVQEVLGTEQVVQEDLSNLVDIGKSIANAIGYDKYVKALVNKVGRTIFVNRPYTGRAPKVLMSMTRIHYGNIEKETHPKRCLRVWRNNFERSSSCQIQNPGSR